MKIAILIISAFMGVIGVIATIALIVDANNGQTGDGLGIMMGLIWIAQSTLTFIYVLGHRYEHLSN